MKKLETFQQFGLSENTLQALKRKGFEEPTPIQNKIIPLLMKTDRDLVGQAQTGTGKTAAFGIPIIEKIKSRARFVQVLILTPTRELAIQISEEINSLKGKKNLHVIPIYGGQSIELQIKQLKKGADIVVGTPGRIIDLINRKLLKLENISYAVIDEADEMLNMGFIVDLEKILTVTNPGRTTLLFSATMPKDILRVAQKYMRDYEEILVKQKQLTIDLTDQIYFEVAKKDKFEALCRIIDIEDYFYGLIFCRTKVDADHVAASLLDRGYDAEALHGDLSQAQREKILNKFKKQHINLLVATDVAARGIDIQELTHVINYSIPHDPEAYVHRIGRTGRAGKEGTAITFITPEEYRKLMYIKKAAGTDIRKERIPDVNELIRVKKERILNDVIETAGAEVPQEFVQIARTLLRQNSPEDTIGAILKLIFEDQLDPANYNEVRDVYPQIKGKTRLFVAKGNKDKMSKRELVNFIRKKAKVDGGKIFDVQVFDSFSFITVPFKEAEQILHCFKKSGKGKRPLVEKAKGRTP